LDTLLGEELIFDFKGTILTRNGAARIDLIALQLNGQPVNPQVLDFVIHTAALVYRTESSGIGDWYELPKGINRITVIKPKKKAKASLSTIEVCCGSKKAQRTINAISGSDRFSGRFRAQFRGNAPPCRSTPQSADRTPRKIPCGRCEPPFP
jgi:hypothetical protein